MDQCEFATDIMFKEYSFLEDIYPSLVGYAFYDFSCTYVFTLVGRKPTPQFQEESVSDYKNRPIGYRVKFKLKSNSVKMYDECSMLRIGTTINNLREFKVFGMVLSQNNGSLWGNPSPTSTIMPKYQKPVTRGLWMPWLISCLPNPYSRKLRPSALRKTSKASAFPIFMYGPPMCFVFMEAVSDGRHLIGCFRNKDIGKVIFSGMIDEKSATPKPAVLSRNYVSIV